MSAVIHFGYVTPDGGRDSGTISLAEGVEGDALLDTLFASYEATGVEALWVEGSPHVVGAFAEHLSVPIGRPRDWEGSPPSNGSDAEPDHEHQWVFDAGRSLKMFGSPKLKRGRVVSCIVDGCELIQMRGR